MGENPTLSGVSADAPGREFHAVADLFPLMRGKAFEELVAGIRDNGLHQPILVDAEGRILDGRNRYRACLQAGVEPRFIEWQGEGSPVELALSLNLRRRHLDESQRAMVAARLAKMLRDQPRTGGKFATRKPLKPHDEAAAQVNISPRLVIHASKVIKDGSEELIAAVESGGLAVSAASILTGLPQDEQARAVAGGAKQAAGKAREIRTGKSAASGPRPSPGRFGVFCLERPAEHANCVSDGLVFLWLAAGALAEAVAALKARGFQQAESV